MGDYILFLVSLLIVSISFGFLIDNIQHNNTFNIVFNMFIMLIWMSIAIIVFAKRTFLK